ncbi:MAG: hypothetical protein WAQ27_05535 [Candidatus Microsaccharimonas sp.]
MGFLQARTIALALFASLFVLFIFPVAAHAEDGSTVETQQVEEPITEPDEPAAEVVESPGTPVVTSPTDSHDTTWVWTPPAGGTTPDAPEVDPSADPAEPVAEQPSDITQYGYELSGSGGVVGSGLVDSNTYTVTVTVTADGDYVFRVWSVTRAGQVSAPAVGNVTIVTPVPEVPEVPVLPPIQPEVIPQPIDTSPVSSKPVVYVGTTTSTNTSGTSETPSSPDFTNNANVLSAGDTAQTTTDTTAAAPVQSSSQGWLIIGLPWYIWLLIAAVLFTAWRWVMSVINNR